MYTTEGTMRKALAGVRSTRSPDTEATENVTVPVNVPPGPTLAGKVRVIPLVETGETVTVE
jgi:hypothetical protein